MPVDLPPVSKVYQDQLTTLSQGLALWNPNPLKEIYDKVSIGDVGYLHEGSFIRMFNVTLPWTHESNRTLGEPEPYEPLDCGPFANTFKRQFDRVNHCSRYVSAEINAGSEQGMTPDDVEGVTCKVRNCGALLSLPNGGHHEDVIRAQAYENYIQAYVDSWFTWAQKNQLGVGRMEDLFLVSGCTLVTSWAAVAFVDDTMDAEISLASRTLDNGGASFVWSNIRGHVLYHNSRFELFHGEQNSTMTRDQCVFIRGFRVNRRDNKMQVIRVPRVPESDDPDIGVVDTIGPPKNENPQCSQYRRPTQRNDGLRNASCPTFLVDDSLGGSCPCLDSIRDPTSHEYPSSTAIQSNGGRCDVSFMTFPSYDSSIIEVLNNSYIAEIRHEGSLDMIRDPTSLEHPSSTTIQSTSNESRCNVSFMTSPSYDSSIETLNYSYIAEIRHEGAFAEDTKSITHDDLPPVNDAELLTVPPQGALKGLNSSFPLGTDHMTTERKEGRFRQKIGLHLTPIPSSEEQLDDLVDFGHELKSAVDSIVQAFPKFRILILGRSGVGKSNLINAILGSDVTTVEHGRKAGVSNIEKEFTSPQDPRLILHDSQGFSHGSSNNFSIVKNFIQTHSQTENLKDRLHAIWLCSAVPIYRGMLLEVGEEEILHMVKECNVPIVAVFTKYDELVESLKPPGTSAHQIDPHVLSLAETELDKMIEPFEETLRGIRWVKVSARPGFSDTLDELIDVTKYPINKSLQLLWAATQQQSMLPRINASIDIGKKRWRDLSRSLNLATGGKSLEKWFKVIHKDIVTIWGIYDPKNVFTQMAKVMSELQQDLVEAGGGTVVRNIRGIMGYIVDLTIVMQSLFFLMQVRMEAFGSRSPMNERLFKVALDAYKHDTEHSLQKVHSEIRSFATVTKAIFKSGSIMKEVERLINDHRLKLSELLMALA